MIKNTDRHTDKHTDRQTDSSTWHFGTVSCSFSGPIGEHVYLDLKTKMADYSMLMWQMQQIANKQIDGMKF